MRDGMREVGLPEPMFEFSEFFTVIFQRVKEREAVKEQKLPVSADRQERMYTLARQLRDIGKLDIDSLATKFKTTDRTIRRDLELLEEFGWVTSTGTTRNKNYSLTEEGLNRLITMQ